MLCICAVALLSGVAAFAQEDGNRDENGKIVRGPYLTNRFIDNWFVGVAGGFNLAVDELNQGIKTTVHGWGGALDVTVGKWFSPCWGARLGYQGLFTRMNDDQGDNKASFNYVHGDVLWNLSNQIGGYKESRVYNAIVYLHAGYLGDIVNRDKMHGQEFGGGAGLLNNFRVHPRVNVTLDIRGLITRGEQYRTYRNGVAGQISALVGLSVNLGKYNWVRASSVADDGALDEANKALAAAKEALAKQEAENEKLGNENDALNGAKKALADKCDSLEKAAKNVTDAPKEIIKEVASKFQGPFTVYYEIGQTELSQREATHLDYIANIILAKEKESTFYLTGSADMSTGSKDVNLQLGKARVESVAKILQEKYNIPADRIVVREPALYDNNDTPELGRSVTIDNK